MLKQRLITAGILILAVVGLIFFSPLWLTQLAFMLIVILGLREWLVLSGVKPGLPGFLWLVAAIAAMVLLYQLPRSSILILLGLSLFYWLFCLLALAKFPQPVLVLDTIFYRPISGLFTLSITWAALVTLHGSSDGPELLMILLLLVWSADTGAYFTGRSLGRVKLLPRVSPGKTLEGLIGGLVLGLVTAVIAATLIGYEGQKFTLFLVLAAFTILISVVGDLAESMLKRKFGVKDSGRLLPGHGGILDRIDSLLAAAPCYAFGILLLERCC